MLSCSDDLSPTNVSSPYANTTRFSNKKKQIVAKKKSQTHLNVITGPAQLRRASDTSQQPARQKVDRGRRGRAAGSLVGPSPGPNRGSACTETRQSDRISTDPVRETTTKSGISPNPSLVPRRRRRPLHKIQVSLALGKFAIESFALRLHRSGTKSRSPITYLLLLDRFVGDRLLLQLGRR